MEVGVAAAAVIYLIAVTLWHAWHGRALSKLGAPGGAAMESQGEPLDSAASNLDTAADELEQFREKTERRFEEIEQAVTELNERVPDGIETGNQSHGNAIDREGTSI
jgi:hypothetical protein